MFSIRQLGDAVGLTTQAIRYYEQIGIMPPPRRADNGYRVYDQSDIERLRFIRGARQLDISLDEIKRILTFRDHDTAPCIHVSALIEQQIESVESRITQLKNLRSELIRIRDTGESLPEDVEMQDCICGLIGSTIEE